MAFTRGCRCGRVRYSAEGPRDRSSLCCCRMCQKAGAAPFMAFVRFSADRVTWFDDPGAADPEICFAAEGRASWLDALDDLRPVGVRMKPSFASRQHPDRDGAGRR